MLAEQTNLRDMMMTDEEEGAAAGSDSVNNTAQVSAGASATTVQAAPNMWYGLAGPA